MVTRTTRLVAGLAFTLFGAACGGAATPSRGSTAVTAPADAAAPTAMASPDADALFAGCIATPLGGRGWKYKCGEVLAIIGDREDVAADALLDGIVDGTRETTPGTLDFAKSAITIAGHSGKRLLMTAKDDAGNVVVVHEVIYFALVPGARLLTCTSSPSPSEKERCHAFLEALARAPWMAPHEPNVTLADATVKIAGRTIDLPSDCELHTTEEGGAIRCANHPALLWAALNDPAKAAAKLADWTREMKGDADAVDTRVACTVEGVDTECHRFGDARGSSYVAQAPVRGSILVAACFVPGADRVPSACFDTFQFHEARATPRGCHTDLSARASSGAFDRSAAAEALGCVTLDECDGSSGPSGTGHVVIIFAPDGHVASTKVDSPPFAGTASGACIERRFASIRIPPFVGNDVKVGKSFTVRR